MSVPSKVLKIVSWNVSGVKSILKKGFGNYINEENPDLICLQETKQKRDDVTVPKFSADFVYPGNKFYEYFDHHKENPGRSGCGVLSRWEPINVIRGIGGHSENDKEGRCITMEYDKFYLVNAYVPNSGAHLVRLDYRINHWDTAFKKYLAGLAQKKPIICCGDMNVAHHEIDIKNSVSNLRTAGYTMEERKNFSELVKSVTTKPEGFYLVDTFRHLYPTKDGAYTFWTHKASQARDNNVGWRLDYILVTPNLIPFLKSAEIKNAVMGSDHCPIVTEIDIEGYINSQQQTPPAQAK